VGTLQSARPGAARAVCHRHDWQAARGRGRTSRPQAAERATGRRPANRREDRAGRDRAAGLLLGSTASTTGGYRY